MNQQTRANARAGKKSISSTPVVAILSVIISLLPVAGVSAAADIAFPGAEGFGAISVGGRGGRVIKVTNLKASGPGSLQAATSAEGARIVVFEVAGVIRGDVEIRHSNITIAGQTAPAPGITIEGRLFAHPNQEGERLHDIVVRFLRFRPSPTSGVNGDTIQLPNSERVILDHLSLSWANDEIIDIIYSSEVTVQWCTLEESDPLGHAKGIAHNFAILSAYPGSGNISIHHNLFAHHSRRLPSLSPYAKDKPGDFRNNVIYDFFEGVGHDGHKPASGINIVANYYKPGPSAWRIFPFNLSKAGNYYLFGNFIEGVGIVDNPHNFGILDKLWIKVNGLGKLAKQPFVTAPVITSTASEAFTQVLLRAGAFPRDRVSNRTINEVRQSGGRWGRNAPDNPDDAWFLEGLSKENPPQDSDNDGMPDWWEDKQELNRYDASDHTRIMSSGYSATEEYINFRADHLLSASNPAKMSMEE